MEKLSKYIVKIITFLMFLLTVNLMSAQVTDLVEVYDNEIKRMGDENSCSVRLIASYFDINYSLAYELLKTEGRQRGKAVNIIEFARAFNKVNKVDYISKAYDYNNSLRKFIEEVAEDNTSYILVSDGHIYYIDIYNDKKNMLFGNYNDRDNKILFYIPIEKKVK